MWMGVQLSMGSGRGRGITRSTNPDDADQGAERLVARFN